MLKLRVITALLLLPAVIIGTYFADSRAFAIGVSLVTMLAAWEWSRLAGIRHIAVRVCYSLLVPVCCYYLFTLPGMAVYMEYTIYTIAFAWLFLAVFIMFDPVQHLGAINPGIYRILSAAAGMILLLAMWWAFVSIHQLPNGPGLVLAMFALVWAADTGAYASGKQWGSHKLAPRVSPGKTWEGVIGGVGLALLVAAATPYILNMNNPTPGIYLLIAVATVLISIYGDLLESVIKRVANVKDSGRILPGHGGILDRIDSLIAAAPIFLSGLLLFGMSA